MITEDLTRWRVRILRANENQRRVRGKTDGLAVPNMLISILSRVYECLGSFCRWRQCAFGEAGSTHEHFQAQHSRGQAR